MLIQRKYKAIILLFVILALPFTSIDSIASDRPRSISFLYLTSPDKDEHSALSGDCTGDTSSTEIDCYFVQTRVSLKLSPQKLPEKMKELQEEMKKEKIDLKKYCQDFNDKTKLNQMNQKLKEFEDTAPQTYSRMKEMLSICDNPSYEKIINFTKKMIEDETRTCKVSSSTDHKPIHFKKIDVNKWIAIEGPSGLCNQVVTYTLEHDSKYPALWTYTQMRSHTDQNDFCKGFEVGKPLIYTWNSNPFELKCDFIEYGF